MQDTVFNIQFSPSLPVLWLAAACGVAFLLAAISLWRGRQALPLRIACIATFLLFLFEPSLIREQRQAVRDVAAIVIDKSQSQQIGTREQVTINTLAYLKEQARKFPDLEIRFVETSGDATATETRLFSALDQALADVPRQRRAGVILVTDGQVHDVPQGKESFLKYGPVHVFLTGLKNEADRQLQIVEAPAYGIVGKTAIIKYKVEDAGSEGYADHATITLNRYEGDPEIFDIEPGPVQTIEVPVLHAGQNVFQLQASPLEGELSSMNNSAALVINGVRDRMKVLLVSGQPYAGGRTWRDLLTADPAVDLVHFTILREPEKVDATPSEELSLIAFPFEELFKVRLYDFDLVIFDRYRLNRILPQDYFDNIVEYVQKGGALLATTGPSYAGPESIYNTPLKEILPGAPTGGIIQKAFVPALTDTGTRHPVSRPLSFNRTEWGPWLRQIPLTVARGDIIMSGADENPLIILDRVGEGRVAQIASDHIWLWTRGYHGGGPYSELLRRVIHWLMKEPELDEQALEVTVDKNQIILRSQNFRQAEIPVEMTRPDGTKETVTLVPLQDGPLQKNIQADRIGIYAFKDPDGAQKFAVIGDINPPELQALKTIPTLLSPLSQESRGGILWLSETQKPDVKLLPAGSSYAGRNWIAFRKNNDYAVKGVESLPLMPAWLAAVILIALAAFTWWREGRS